MRGNSLQLEVGRFRLDTRRKFFTIRMGQVAQGCGWSLAHGDIQEQTWYGRGQPDLAGGVPADCKGVGQDDLWRSLPTWPVISTCNVYQPEHKVNARGWRKRHFHGLHPLLKFTVCPPAPQPCNKMKQESNCSWVWFSENQNFRYSEMWAQH